MKKVLLLLTIIVLSMNIAVAEMVMFNTKTLKYHKPSCQYARKCTKNCIKIEKQEAIKRGGIPCKVCGG